MMRTLATRRAVLTGLGAAMAAPAAALDADTAIRPALRSVVPAPRSPSEVGSIIEQAGLGGKVGFVVADARTGQLLETRARRYPMVPASVTKSVTTIYALDRLGAGHRFRTRLRGTGEVVDGLLDGDLVLEASGDPTLGSDDLGTMAKALKMAGIRAVRGRFLVYVPPFPAVRWIDPEQPYQVSYNPGVDGLNLNLNRVHFEWKRLTGQEYSVTMQARGYRYSPGVHTSTMQIVDRPGPVYEVSRADGIDRWSVARGALGKEGARWLPVSDPRDYALDAFAAILAAEGISAPQPERVLLLPQGRVLCEVESGPLSDILRLMLKDSINLTAEVVGLSATLSGGHMPASLTASAGEMSDWLAQVSQARRPDFVDHSGLSDENRISPHDMVAALAHSGPDGALAALMKPWYFRTANGGTDRENPVHMVAKTGTLNFVSALAGYILPPGGRPLAFAIFARNGDRRAGLSREERERPPGGKAWARRARTMQDKLLKRWTALYA